jgi:enterochelin esterase-like enzyme
LISNIWIKTVPSSTTILIEILLVFVFAEAMGPGCAHLVQPYDGTVWNNPPLSLPPGVIHGTYHSVVTNVEVGYNIYLPPQYATNPTQSFPVIYWLHGGQSQDENWDVPNLEPLLDFAVRSGQLPPMIMVWANCGHNTKYMDAAVGSSMYGVLMIETTIIRELIPHIDATYRTIASKEGRAVQGGSGGGMGALRFAFKYPQMFSSVFAFNPAVDDNASNVMINERGLMAAMFNNDPILFDQNTVFTLAKNNAANIRGLPIHIAIGSLDDLLPYNQDLFATLDELGIPHDTLEIISGADHSTLVLPNKIENLQFAAEHFVHPQRPWPVMKGSRK